MCVIALHRFEPALTTELTSVHYVTYRQLPKQVSTQLADANMENVWVVWSPDGYMQQSVS